VSVFDGSILATAAVSAPEVMVELAKPVMECFADLSDEERGVLFDTFQAWSDYDGSVRTGRGDAVLSPKYRPLPDAPHRAAHRPFPGSTA
jgi:hypothetical protein